MLIPNPILAQLKTSQITNLSWKKVIPKPKFYFKFHVVLEENQHKKKKSKPYYHEKTEKEIEVTDLVIE